MPRDGIYRAILSVLALTVVAGDDAPGGPAGAP
jgi:hypothetical protein